jgi:ClpP class serine protease
MEPRAFEQLSASLDAISFTARPAPQAPIVETIDTTAIIAIRGPIARRASWIAELLGACSLERIATEFGAAIDNPAVKNIVLNLDSPGGEISGVSEFASQVAAGAAIKPVTAYVGDLAASAAYWIASHCGEIVISPIGMAGSIGVVSAYRPRDKNTIEVVSSSSPLKAASPETEAGRAEAQRLVDQLAAVFVEAVAAARGVTSEHVIRRYGRGGVLVGRHAVAAGIADRVGLLSTLFKDHKTPLRSPLHHAAAVPVAEADPWAILLARPTPDQEPSSAPSWTLWDQLTGRATFDGTPTTNP